MQLEVKQFVDCLTAPTGKVVLPTTDGAFFPVELRQPLTIVAVGGTLYGLLPEQLARFQSGESVDQITQSTSGSRPLPIPVKMSKINGEKSPRSYTRPWTDPQQVKKRFDGIRAMLADPDESAFAAEDVVRALAFSNSPAGKANATRWLKAGLQFAVIKTLPFQKYCFA